MEIPVLYWIIFNVFIFLMLFLDLGVFHKQEHEVKMKEAFTWTLVWVAAALIFNVLVYFYLGEKPAIEFFTGYLIEKSLSMDNIFVFVVIFEYFKIPMIHQHRVLFFGILGAVVFRALFIFTGVTLVSKFHWLLYVFGAFLVFTGIKLSFSSEKEADFENSLVARFTKKIIPMTNTLHGSKFFIIENGKRLATPLFLALLIIEASDILFALDSIPAIMAITLDPFIIYTSNIFAILGLRSLYFVLKNLVDRFHYLKYGLSLILVFVGVKMLMIDIYKIPTLYSLLFIASMLTLPILASFYFPSSHKSSLGR